MKKILLIPLLLLSFGLYAQTISSLPSATTLGGTEVVPGVQSGTTKKISINQINTFVSSYYWPLAGSATLTGTVSIDGDVHDLILSATALNLTGTSEMNLQAPDIDLSASSGDLTINATNGIDLNPTGDFLLRGQISASPTTEFFRGDGTWAVPTGGGATAAGSTGNVQYKSAGGGLQAEAAFSYDSATNTLDVDVLTVDTEAYDATGWNGDLTVPTKDAIRDKLESTFTIDQASVSTAGGTITLDLNSQIQRSFVGSATFSSAKVLALSNVLTTAGVPVYFHFFFEITNVAAELTMPSDFLMSSSDFDGTDWVPPAVGKYELGGSYDQTNDLWYVKVDGPFN